MSISLTPLEDKIIVKQAEAETQTASGLFIPDNAKEKPQQGEVLAVGPGRRDDKGERIPMDVHHRLSRVTNRNCKGRSAAAGRPFVRIRGRSSLLWRERTSASPGAGLGWCHDFQTSQHP